jgi:voltage-dependent anion channel protein 2
VNNHAFYFLFPQLEVQYKHGYAGVSTSVGLTPSPIMEFSTVLGSNEIGLGGEVGFDSSTGNPTKYNAALSYTKPDFTAALFL